MFRAPLVFAVLAISCYSPAYKDCDISCATNECPSGLACISGMCRTGGNTGACAAGSDGGLFEDAPTDVAADAPYPTGTWGSAMLVDVGMMGVVDPSVSPDLLDLFFMKGGTIYETRRSAIGSAWGTPVAVAFTTAGVNDQTPSIQADDVTLLFSSTRAGGSGGYDLWQSTRLNKTALFRTPNVIANVNSGSDDSGPNLTTDGTIMVFASLRNGTTNDLFTSTRAHPTDPWGAPTPLSTIDTTMYAEVHPNISPDGLTIYFQSTVNGNADLYTAHRTTRTGDFAASQPITELNSPLADGDPWVSPDGHHIFFSSSRAGSGNQIYEATR